MTTYWTSVVTVKDLPSSAQPHDRPNRTMLPTFQWNEELKTSKYDYQPTVDFLHYLKDVEEFGKTITLLEEDIKGDPVPMVAWDQEWKWDPDDDSEGPVVLTQFASHKRIIVYRHDLDDYQKGFPPEYLALMKNANILKVGRYIMNDAEKVRKDYGADLPIRGLVDLQHMSDMIDRDNWSSSKWVSLARLVSYYMGCTLAKELQGSSWDAPGLSREQLSYAANDVAVVLELFKIFTAKAEAQGRPFDFFGVQGSVPTRKNRPSTSVTGKNTTASPENRATPRAASTTPALTTPALTTPALSTPALSAPGPTTYAPIINEPCRPQAAISPSNPSESVLVLPVRVKETQDQSLKRVDEDSGVQSVGEISSHVLDK